MTKVSQLLIERRNVKDFIQIVTQIWKPLICGSFKLHLSTLISYINIYQLGKYQTLIHAIAKFSRLYYFLHCVLFPNVLEREKDERLVKDNHQKICLWALCLGNQDFDQNLDIAQRCWSTSPQLSKQDNIFVHHNLPQRGKYFNTKYC